MNLIEQVKIMRKMETSQQVLCRIEFIQAIKNGESYKGFIGLDNTFKSYEKLETIAYKIAVKKAETIEEIENCAASIEKNYTGQLDSDDWAEEVRIKAYGIEWYLKRLFNTPAYQGFINFLEVEGIKNPLKELEEFHNA